MTPKPAKPPRKPVSLLRWDGDFRAKIDIWNDGRPIAYVSPIGIEGAEDARRLAKWLLRYADWTESRTPKRRGRKP